MKKIKLLLAMSVMFGPGCITYPEVSTKPATEIQYARNGNYVVPIDRSTGYPVGTPERQIYRKEYKKKFKKSAW